MAIYTLLLEHDSASYTIQIEADSHPLALRLWLASLDDLDDWPPCSADDLQRQLDERPPLAVGHLTNVWKYNLALDHDIGQLHVIKTDLLPDP